MPIDILIVSYSVVTSVVTDRRELKMYQSSLASQLRHVEPVVIRLPEDGDEVPGLKAELHLHIHVGQELHGVVVVESDHLFVAGPDVYVSPTVTSSSPTLSSSGRLQQLPGDPLVIHLDLRDHVAGHVPRPPAALSPVESVCVLLADDLDELSLPEGQLLVAGLGVGGHGGRVVVEESHEDPAGPAVSVIMRQLLITPTLIDFPLISMFAIESLIN